MGTNGSALQALLGAISALREAPSFAACRALCCGC